MFRGKQNTKNIVHIEKYNKRTTFSYYVEGIYI